ncbi:9326_t:CDS:2, partial [Diversispora eburnea]
KLLFNQNFNNENDDESNNESGENTLEINESNIIHSNEQWVNVIQNLTDMTEDRNLENENPLDLVTVSHTVHPADDQISKWAVIDMIVDWVWVALSKRSAQIFTKDNVEYCGLSLLAVTDAISIYGPTMILMILLTFRAVQKSLVKIQYSVKITICKFESSSLIQ